MDTEVDNYYGENLITVCVYFSLNSNINNDINKIIQELIDYINFLKIDEYFFEKMYIIQDEVFNTMFDISGDRMKFVSDTSVNIMHMNPEDIQSYKYNVSDDQKQEFMTTFINILHMLSNYNNVIILKQEQDLETIKNKIGPDISEILHDDIYEIDYMYTEYSRYVTKINKYIFKNNVNDYISIGLHNFFYINKNIGIKKNNPSNNINNNTNNKFLIKIHNKKQSNLVFYYNTILQDFNKNNDIDIDYINLFIYNYVDININNFFINSCISLFIYSLRFFNYKDNFISYEIICSNIYSDYIINFVNSRIKEILKKLTNINLVNNIIYEIIQDHNNKKPIQSMIGFFRNIFVNHKHNYKYHIDKKQLDNIDKNIIKNIEVSEVFSIFTGNVISTNIKTFWKKNDTVISTSVLKPNNNMILNFYSSHKPTCVYIAYVFDKFSIENTIATYIIDFLINSNFFHEMRTLKNIGYVCASGFFNIFNSLSYIPYVTFLIQSEVYTREQIITEIENFVNKLD